MKPALAFHRSLAFWAGLLTVVSACWGWWDSCSHVSGLQWGQVTTVSTAHGNLISRHAGAAFPFDIGRKTIPPRRLSSESQPFPEPFFVRTQASSPDPTAPDSTQRARHQLMINYSPPGSWTLHLPYWIIVVAVFVPWFILVLWQSWRRTRVSLASSP